MRTLLNEMTNIGLNYGNGGPKNAELNIAIVLKERYDDINGFVAELVDHCIENHKTIQPSKVFLSGTPLRVWKVICYKVFKETQDLRWKTNVEKGPEVVINNAFAVKMRGYDEDFLLFNILTAKQTRFKTKNHWRMYDGK